MSFTFPTVIFVEGNIGSGKSTLMGNLQKIYQNHPLVEFFDEPVEDWLKFKDNTSGKNVLELYYSDPHKYGFMFQNIIVQSKMQKYLKIACTPEASKKCFIMERSFFSDFLVFTQLLRENGSLSDIDMQYLQKWFEFCKNELFHQSTVHVIYVDVETTVCSERIAKRLRQGEEGIPIDYLDRIDGYYKKFMADQTVLPSNRATILPATGLTREQVLQEVKSVLDNYVMPL
jgi:deoxycitidine kinase